MKFTGTTVYTIFREKKNKLKIRTRFEQLFVCYPYVYRHFNNYRIGRRILWISKE
jgi:hypothetical protein